MSITTKSTLFDNFEYHARRITKTLVVFGGITILTRGIWDLSAKFIFPDDTFTSCMVSIVMGIAIIAIFSPDKIYTIA